MGEFDFGASAEGAQDSQLAPQLNVPYLGPAFLRDVEVVNDFGNADDPYRVLVFEYAVFGPNETPGVELDTPRIHRQIWWEPREEDTLPPEDGEGKPTIQKRLDLLAYTVKYFIDDSNHDSREEAAAEVVQGTGDSLAEFWDDLRENIVNAVAPATTPDLPPSSGKEIHALEQEMEAALESGDKETADDVKETLRGLYKEYGQPTFIRLKVLGNVYQGNARVQTPLYPGFISDEESESPVTLSQREEDENREFLRHREREETDTEEVEEEEFDFEMDEEDEEEDEEPTTSKNGTASETEDTSDEEAQTVTESADEDEEDDGLEF